MTILDPEAIDGRLEQVADGTWTAAQFIDYIADLVTAAKSEPTDTEPQLVKLVREIHETVTRPPIVITGIPTDIEPGVLAEALKDWRPVFFENPDVQVTQPNQVTLEFGDITEGDGAVEFGDSRLVTGTCPDEAPTPYGVRIVYGDGSSEDLDNIDSVLVRDKESNTFPFGFQEVEEEIQHEGGTSLSPAHRAGFFRAEDGEFVAFSGEQQPKPFNGWGG